MRMLHRESGASATAQSSKSQQTNLREAFKTIVKSDTFESWRKMETAERILNGSSVREKVRRMMAPENLKIEVGI